MVRGVLEKRELRWVECSDVCINLDLRYPEGISLVECARSRGVVGVSTHVGTLAQSNAVFIILKLNVINQ